IDKIVYQGFIQISFQVIEEIHFVIISCNFHLSLFLHCNSSFLFLPFWGRKEGDFTPPFPFYQCNSSKTPSPGKCKPLPAIRLGWPFRQFPGRNSLRNRAAAAPCAVFRAAG